MFDLTIAFDASKQISYQYVYLIICFQEIILHDDPFGLAPVQENLFKNIYHLNLRMTRQPTP